MKVSELWTYPVQSLQGERRPELTFTEAGVAFERYFVVLDVEMNCVAHASRPTWKNLIKWRARWLDEAAEHEGAPRAEIQFEDGEALRSDDSRLNARMSERFGRALRLIRNDGALVKPAYESAPCHFLTSASLKEFQHHYPQGNFAPARFRPNLVVECGEAIGFIEQQWLGREMRVGPITMRVTEDCARCALTTRPQGDLPMDAGILHTVQQVNRTVAGAYAAILVSGTIREWDSVSL